MIALPIVFYMLRRHFRYKDAKKRTFALVYMVLMLAVDVALCLGLYQYTINRQPLLVAERSAKAIYEAGLSQADIQQALQQEGVVDGTVVVHGDPSMGQWTMFHGAKVDMPDKSIEIDGTRMMPVVLEAPSGERMVLAMQIMDQVPQSKLQQVYIFWPDQVGDMIDSVTFFQVDTLR